MPLRDEETLASAIRHALDEIPVREGLDRIRDKIRRHEMAIADFRVIINQLDDAPEDWPFQSIELVITADDADGAEEIADQVITAIQKSRGVTRAMAIDETYEEA